MRGILKSPEELRKVLEGLGDPKPEFATAQREWLATQQAINQIHMMVLGGSIPLNLKPGAIEELKRALVKEIAELQAGKVDREKVELPGDAEQRQTTIDDLIKLQQAFEELLNKV